MSNPEKECKWTFEPHTGREDGPNDALGQSFKQRPYASLVRESIQNSLDVPIREDISVKVEFSFGQIRSDRFTNFFELKKHIQGCLDYFSDNIQAQTKYSAMSACFDDSYIETMPYIKVSDYNTKGMMYEKDNNNLPFYAFVRAASISVKNEGATGGTYGFGKAAYFQISPINTILVSTQTDDGHNFFEGASVLCTHTFNGEKVTSVGFYDNNDGEPISDIEQIPTKFRRKESGTDFYILGFNHDEAEGAITEMVEEILRSFCIAILKQHLIVEIIKPDKQIININHQTVNDYLISTFPSSIDKSGQSRSLNPRPYFDAVLNVGTSKKYRYFTKNYHTLGMLELYVEIDKNATDRIIYMRRPLMYVASRKTSSNIGFYGVLVCQDISGDKLLSKLENASHSEWKKENYRDDITNKIRPEAQEAIDELSSFLVYCIDQISGCDNRTAMDMTALGDYLYVPDALIEEDEDVPYTSLGSPSGDFQDEGGSITTDIRELKKDKEDKTKSNLGSILLSDNNSFEAGQGEEIAGTGHKENYKSHDKGGQPLVGDKFQKGSLIEDNGTHITVINVPIRIVAQVEDNTVYHYIMIHLDHDITNGSIELTVCGEQSDEIIELKYSSNGNFKQNIISNLNLNVGVNRIKVQFTDNMMHSIKTKLYHEN